MSDANQAQPDPQVIDNQTVEASPLPHRPSILAGFAGGLLGGALTTALLAGGAVVAWPHLQGRILHQQEQEIAAIAQSLDQVHDRIASLEGSSTNQPADATASTAVPLSQRQIVPEPQPRDPMADPRLVALSQKAEQTASDVIRLTGEMESLRRAIPPEGTILRLAERAELAEKAVRDVSAQQQSQQALLLVLGQLREAVNHGDPFDVELRAARRIAPVENAVQLDALAPYAERGIPRRETLLETFPAASKEILITASVPNEESLWRRIRYKLASLISLRRVDGIGDGPNAVVARAEAQVKMAALDKATQELAALQGPPAAAAAPWTTAANSRVIADRALSELSANLLAQTAPKIGG